MTIQNVFKVDEINIEVRNRTDLNLVGYGSKVYRIEKIWTQPNINIFAILAVERAFKNRRPAMTLTVNCDCKQTVENSNMWRQVPTFQSQPY